MGGTELEISGLLLGSPELLQSQRPKGGLTTLFPGLLATALLSPHCVSSLDLSQLEWVSSLCNLSIANCIGPFGYILRRINIGFPFILPGQHSWPSPTLTVVNTCLNVVLHSVC